MPKLCDTHVIEPLKDHVYLKFLAVPAGNLCNAASEKMDFLGIWGEEDIPEVTDWYDWRTYFKILQQLYEPEAPWFQMACHLTILVFGVFFGLTYRSKRIKSNNQLKQQHLAKERQLSQTLWDTMMEKSELKGKLQEAVDDKNQSCSKLDLAKQEIEQVKMKNMALERVCALQRAEKDNIENRIGNFMSNHNSYIEKMQTATNVPTNGDLKKLTNQVNGLQNLVKEVQLHFENIDEKISKNRHNSSSG